VTERDRLVPPWIERLTPYQPGKPTEELERELGIRDAIKLASNESPMGPSPKVVEELRRAAAGANRYPDATAFGIRRDLGAFHGVSMDQVGMGNGSNDLIDLICRTFASPSEHAVIGDPSFVCYELGLITANVPFTKVPLRDKLFWNEADLLAAVRPETKLVFLANPNNPTGTYLGRTGLETLLRELPARVVAVIDEAYVQFADAPDFASALGMRELRERLIVLRTFSKAYGLAAARCGYMVAPAELVGYVDRVRPPFNVNGLAQQAARIALGDTDHVERYVAMNRAERGKLVQSLSGLGLRVAPSQANFILVDFARPGREVYDRLLRKGVIVRPMPPPVETWLRITVGLPGENERLVAAVKEVLS
jgi:histidinol-phosphate aminotransferase